MSRNPDRDTVKERLRSSVARLNKYEQGETIYGVRNFNYHNNQGWSSSGKTFRDKQKCREYYLSEHPLRDPDIHDTIFYSGTVAMTGAGGRDTYIIDSKEEQEIILSNITILSRRKPGESTNNEG